MTSLTLTFLPFLFHILPIESFQRLALVKKFANCIFLNWKCLNSLIPFSIEKGAQENLSASLPMALSRRKDYAISFLRGLCQYHKFLPFNGFKKTRTFCLKKKCSSSKNTFLFLEGRAYCLYDYTNCLCTVKLLRHCLLSFKQAMVATRNKRRERLDSK